MLTTKNKNRFIHAVWLDSSVSMQFGVSPLNVFTVKSTCLVFAMVALAVTAIRAPLLDIPFERDEGEYAYIAWRLGHHELPYRDWVDQKPPGIFWVYRLALALPLEPIKAVHSVGLLFSAASACAIFSLARHFLSRCWAAAAAALFALLAADPLVHGTAANTELFMLLALVLSQLAFLALTADGRRSVFLMAICGVLTGLGTTFKQVAGVNWFFLVAVYPVFCTGEKRLRGVLSFASWSAAGMGTVWAFIALYFFLRHGLGDLIYNVFTHNLEYINSVPWSARLKFCTETLVFLARTEVVVWVLSIAGLVALWLTGRMKLFVFLAAWAAASMVGVSASGYFFPHYFQQTLPVLSVTATLGAEALCSAKLWGVVPKWAWGRAAVLGIALAVLPAVTIYPFIFEYSPAEAVRQIYPGNVFAEMPDLGRRIAQVTKPDDRVLIFGAEAELLFYAQRVSATRYIFLFPLYGPYRDVRERQIATAREITLSRPAAAVDIPNKLFFWPGSEQFFTQWSRAYFQENFSVDVYLSVDQEGIAHLIPHDSRGEPSLAHGQWMLGALLVRKSR